MLLSVLFCGTVFADTITINWGVDNQPYTTTTCEVGGDVVLPSVSKRGHIFRGWTPEHFNRGTFQKWSYVHKTKDYYLADYYNNTTPKQNDYIVVTDVSDYIPENLKFTIVAKQACENSECFKNVTITYQNNTIKYDRIPMNREISLLEIPIKIKSTGDNWQYIALQDILYKGVVYHTGDIFLNNGSWWFNNISLTASMYFTQISGTWKFVYDGVWETDGIAVWKPVEQIISEKYEFYTDNFCCCVANFCYG